MKTKRRFVFEDIDRPENSSIDELAKIIVQRLGLSPRKANATKNMHRILLELYERKKQANYKHKPELAIMTVDEMAFYAGITRQTMYEYLPRWLDLKLIVKESMVVDNRVIIGYRLNGNTLLEAFEKSEQVVKNFLERTKSFIQELQNEIKKEKIKNKSKK